MELFSIRIQRTFQLVSTIIEENVIAKIHNFNHESTYSKNNSKKTVFGLGTFDLG